MLAQGEKAVANQDEDSLTIATAAALDCLGGMDRSAIGGAYLASTTMPYLERQNAGIMAAALNLREDLRSADFAGAINRGPRPCFPPWKPWDQEASLKFWSPPPTAAWAGWAAPRK